MSLDPETGTVSALLMLSGMGWGRGSSTFIILGLVLECPPGKGTEAEPGLPKPKYED